MEKNLETKVKGFSTVYVLFTNGFENNSNTVAEDVSFKANYKF